MQFNQLLRKIIFLICNYTITQLGITSSFRKVLDPTPEFDEEVSLESPQPIETNGSCRIDDGNIAAGELSMSSEDSDLTAHVEV